LGKAALRVGCLALLVGCARGGGAALCPGAPPSCPMIDCNGVYAACISDGTWECVCYDHGTGLGGHGSAGAGGGAGTSGGAGIGGGAGGSVTCDGTAGADGGTPDGAEDGTAADAGPNGCESDGSASDARQE